MSETSPTIRLAAGRAAQELGRARNIGVVYALIGLITAIWAPLLDGYPAGKLPIALVMVAFTLASLCTAWLASTGRYTRLVFRIYGAIAALTSTAILVYLGPFSPTALAVTLGIAFFGQGSDRPGAWAICLSAIAAYLLVFVLILTGLVPDVGVFRGDEAGLGGRLFMAVMAPLVLIVTLLQAQASHEALSTALTQMAEATLEERRRALQLQEAQAELDRQALQDGGRLTGQTLGSYRLGRLLGRGGVGEVYEALDERSARVVAVKVLNGELAGDGSVRQRFEREGSILARLSSPHVVRVHEHGEHEGTLFIAMEKLDGLDLAATLRSYSRLSPEQAQVLLHQCAHGLHEAHEAGVVHRDIKPRNIFLTSDQVWKVLDFGVSKLTDMPTVLTVGQILGTAHYMAPEQASGESVDLRADVYALGAVLYRVLTGRSSVEGSGHRALLKAAFRRPLRPRSLAPDLSPQLEAVLAIAMAPHPDERFASVLELDQAMTEAVSGQLAASWLRRAERVPWSRG